MNNLKDNSYKLFIFKLFILLDFICLDIFCVSAHANAFSCAYVRLCLRRARLRRSCCVVDLCVHSHFQSLNQPTYQYVAALA